ATATATVTPTPRAAGVTCATGDVVWTNAASGSWHDPANWSTNATPAPTHNVCIPQSGITVTLSQNNLTSAINSLRSQATVAITRGTLSIAAPSQTLGLSITSDESTSGTLSGDGAMTIPSGGVFTFSGGQVFGTDVLNILDGARLVIDGNDLKTLF